MVVLMLANVGTHGVEVGGFAVHSSGKRVVINATIDNLLKGAATQALQVSVFCRFTDPVNRLVC